jgi:pilus assembly protein Flp/PilA
MKHWVFARFGRFGGVMLSLAEDKHGVTMLEYGLIAALIAAVCVGAVTTLGTDLSTALINIASSI